MEGHILKKRLQNLRNSENFIISFNYMFLISTLSDLFR